MKITMIGKSGSGKTSFMSGLYESLVVNSVGGFRIVPAVLPVSSEEFVSVSPLEKLSFSELGYKFPSSTNQTTLWSFDLMHNFDYVCSLEWIDYRGGILDDTLDEIETIEKKRLEIRELNEHIRLSNAVLLFIDSIKFTYYINNLGLARRESGIDRILNLLNNYKRLYPNRHLTIVVVATKIDAIDKKWRENNYNLLFEKIQSALDMLCYMCQKSNGAWRGIIVPISAVGENNATTTIVPPPSIQRTLISSSEIIRFPEPINVSKALFYCVEQTMILMSNYSQEQIIQASQDIKNIVNRYPALKKLVRRVTNTQYPDETSESPKVKLENERKLMEIYNTYINLLSQEIGSDGIMSICRQP